MQKNEEKYGCIFCLTGKEMTVAQEINRIFPEVHAFAVLMEKPRTENGHHYRVTETMLPGYVFFRAPSDFQAVGMLHRQDVIRVMRDETHDWHLVGQDAQFAQFLSENAGALGFSKARQVGDRVVIVSGPLKELEGYIKKVDKRGRSCFVEIPMKDRTIRKWMGYEMVEDSREADCIL